MNLLRTAGILISFAPENPRSKSGPEPPPAQKIHNPNSDQVLVLFSSPHRKAGSTGKKDPILPIAVTHYQDISPCGTAHPSRNESETWRFEKWQCTTCTSRFRFVCCLPWRRCRPEGQRICNRNGWTDIILAKESNTFLCISRMNLICMFRLMSTIHHAIKEFF